MQNVPIPKECDLQNFHDMPLDVVRLRASELRLRSSADEFRAAVLLWGGLRCPWWAIG